jgi:deazaflavin-dependent oxidoreductase (nitroreductase family)
VTDRPTSDDGSYQKPQWFTRHVFNNLVVLATKLGISVWGSRILRVRGRRSGRWYETPVNVLAYGGRRYLVAPRGETQWVRNIRGTSTGELCVGRRRELIRVREVPDAEKLPIVREYLRRWSWEVGQFFHGVGPGASDAVLAEVSQRHPVFAIY